MPKVGNTEFPYTKEGMAKAKAWSEMTGKPIKMKKKYKGGEIPEYGFGGWLKKRLTPSKKLKKTFNRITNPAGSKRWWNKHVKRGVINTGLKAIMGDKGAQNRLMGINKMSIGSAPIDPNLFGARQRFGSGQNIAGLLDELMAGGRKFEEGGNIPAGRRMYGTTKKKKKSLQTADIGPVRGMKKGGKIPKGWHV